MLYAGEHDMTDRFLICLPYTLSMECPYPNDWSNPANLSDDPDDPGGRTMCGITQSEYNIYRQNNGLPLRDVLLITQPEGYWIYDNSYWLPKSPALLSGLDLSFFDTDVNCGPGGATRILQNALGVAIDGLWGPITQGAVEAIADVPAAIRAFTAARLAYYEALPGWVYFGNGWSNRTAAINTDSLSMTTSPGSLGVRIARPFVKSVRAW